MVRKHKKLYWVEHTPWGGALYLTKPFEVVGFETKQWGWGPDDATMLMERVLPDLETWQPDIIVLWMPGTACRITEEPAEWITAHRLIRENPDLQHTRIMAFLEFEESTPEQEAIWQERYDFHTGWPIRVVEHAKVAKRLVGEKVEGFEGVIHSLLCHGNWEIQDYFLTNQAAKDEMRPDAEGQFTSAPVTHLLTVDANGGYVWSVDRMQVETPTYLVYAIKDLQAWREGLNELEIARLATLAERATQGHQLFVGVNDTLLQTDTPVVVKVIEQTQQAGGWQVFINEHLWFEGIFSGLQQRVRAILYENKRALWPIAM